MDGIMLSHDTYNRIMQMVDQYHTILPSGEASYGKLTDDMREKDLVWVFNTGSDLSKGTPVSLSEPQNNIHNDWAAEFSFDGAEATENNEIAGVTVEAIPSQSVGLAKVNGLCIVSGVTIDSTTDTHVTIDIGGNLTTAAGGPLVILGTLTAIDTFYGVAEADLVCNLSSRGGGGGIAFGTFNADMLTTDATGDVHFDPVDNPDEYGGLDGDFDCGNEMELSATSGDKCLVWTNDQGDVLRIMVVKGEVNKSFSNKVIGTLVSAITSGGGSSNINITYADHPDLSEPYPTISANNECKKVADSGKVVVVICNHDLSRNTIVEVECDDP